MVTLSLHHEAEVAISARSARNRLLIGRKAVSGGDHDHSVPPRSSRPFSPVSAVTLSLFSIQMGTSRTSPGWIPSRALRMVSVRLDMRGHAVFIRTTTATCLFDMFCWYRMP